MRRAWGGKLPEEFSQRDMLAFMADTDLLLGGSVSAETLSAIHAAGYDYTGGAVIPRPGADCRRGAPLAVGGSDCGACGS